MQRYGTDSSRPGAPASLDPGQGDGRGDGGGADAVVELAEHQRAIDAERKRQSGSERAHQREKARLEKQIENLQRQLQARQAPAVPAEADPLLSRIPANDPVRDVLGVVLDNQRQYGQFVNDDYNARTAAERTRALSEAVRGSGVPADWLDDWLDDNGEELDERTLRLAARDYRREKEIEELKAQVSREQTASETAETRVREELGVARPFTATGRPPVGKTVDDQLREATEFLAELEDPRSPHTRDQRMMWLPRANKVKTALEAWKAAGNRGKHPSYE